MLRPHELTKSALQVGIREDERSPHLTGGFGGEVAAIIAQEAFDALDAPVTRVASLDVPAPFSPPLEDAMLPNADKIHDAAVDVLSY